MIKILFSVFIMITTLSNLSSQTTYEVEKGTIVFFKHDRIEEDSTTKTILFYDDTVLLNCFNDSLSHTHEFKLDCPFKIVPSVGKSSYHFEGFQTTNDEFTFYLRMFSIYWKEGKMNLDIATEDTKSTYVLKSTTK